MTAAVLPVSVASSTNARAMVQRLVCQLPYDETPEMLPPPRLIVESAPPGYTRDLLMYPDTPYFNGSTYCNRLNMRFAAWLRHPATIALIKAFGNYYREAARETPPALIMIVKGGARSVHGYYVHMSLHDALSSWCDLESLPQSERPRIQDAVFGGQRQTTTMVYTTQTIVNEGSTPEMLQAARLDSSARLASVIRAARGGWRE